VNDIPGLGETIPHWFHHAVAGEDMLGLSDVVFPCFLFCVGLSVPFAIKNRVAKGDSTIQIISHICQRTVALLVMGLFSMNSFGETAKLLGINWALLKIISIVAFFMIWNVYPKASGTKKKLFSALQIAGWIILALIALFFVRTPPKYGEVQLLSGIIPVGLSMRPAYIFQYLIIAICAFFPAIANYLKNKNIGKLIGNLAITIVLFYLFLFKGANADGMIGMRPGWWQILGLIGWTYVYTAVIFLFSRNKISVNLTVWLLFTFFCIATNLGWTSKIGISGFIPGNGSFLMLSFGGVIASMLMLRNNTAEKIGKLSSTYVAITVLMLAAGFFAHSFAPHKGFIISKLGETCTWIFFCLAISFAFLTLLHWLTDIKGKKSWFDIIKPAGSSTLTCYVIPSIWYCLVSIFAINFPAFTKAGIGGLIKSLVFAFMIIGITWLLGKIHIKLKI
jgi:hypothetical protein